MAAPAFGSAGTYYNPGGTGTSAAIPVPASVAANDIIEVHLYIESTATVTPPTGFTEKTPSSPISATGPGAHTHRIFWKRPTGADSGTYSFTWTGAAYREGFALRFTGCVTSGDPYDTGAGAPNSAQASADSTTTPAVSLTTQGADRLLSWAGTNFTGGNWTPPTSFTERADGAPGDSSGATLTQATAGATGSITGTCSGSGYRTAWLGALLPTSGGPQSRTASDNAVATDSVARVVSLPRMPTDNAVATDAAVKSAQLFNRPATDNAVATDIAARTITFSRPTNDSAAATDVATKSAQLFSRTTTDSATASDSVSHVAGKLRTAADNATATDVATKSSQVFVRTAVDTAAATDVV